MEKLEITKKECSPLNFGGFIIIKDGPFYEDKDVLDAETSGLKAAEDHGRLFVDVISTYQKCGLLPSELLTQRDQLKEALEEMNRVLSKSYAGPRSVLGEMKGVYPVKKAFAKTFIKAEQALKSLNSGT